MSVTETMTDSTTTSTHSTQAASDQLGGVLTDGFVPGEGIDFRNFQTCVHCGLCTSSCPTYIELGDENDCPRGRIYLMRAVAEGRVQVDAAIRTHLAQCLDCRSCETACPSGVHYSRLIEPFRMDLEEHLAKRFDLFRDTVLYHLFPYANRIRLALTPVRIVQKLGLYDWLEQKGFFRLLPGRLGHMATLVNAPIPSGPRLPEFLPAKGERRAKVAFFTGCVGDAMFRHVHWATVRCLQENGCEVVVPRGQGCCGAIHYHAGSRAGGKKFADQNVAAFAHVLNDVDAIICNHGGCGAMLQEYPNYWQDDQQEARRRFSEKVVDINAFLDDLGLVAPRHPIRMRVTYHASCHLAHAQGVHDAPKRILHAIPELDAVPLDEEEICCGSAGTYNLNQPEMAARLMDRKMERIAMTGADAVLASNAGCLLQIEREIRRRRLPLGIYHPIELLDCSYTGQPLR